MRGTAKRDTCPGSRRLAAMEGCPPRGQGSQGLGTWEPQEGAICSGGCAVFRVSVTTLCLLEFLRMTVDTTHMAHPGTERKSPQGVHPSQRQEHPCADSPPTNTYEAPTVYRHGPKGWKQGIPVKAHALLQAPPEFRPEQQGSRCVCLRP